MANQNSTKILLSHILSQRTLIGARKAKMGVINQHWSLGKSILEQRVSGVQIMCASRYAANSPTSFNGALVMSTRTPEYHMLM